MGKRGQHKRRMASLAVVSLIASLALTWMPGGPASAETSAPGGQFAQFDWEGTDTGLYGPNSVVMIAVGAIDYQCDTFYPVADVYVIAGGSQPGDGATLSDVSGGVNVVFGTWGGGIVDELIAVTAPSGKLGEGTYSVVFDECQNGKFDADKDAYFEDVIVVDFPEGELPPIDPAIAALKGRAGEQATSWRRMLDAYAIYVKIEELYSTLECVSGGIVSCLISTATDALEDALKEQFMTAFGLVDPKEAALDVAEDYTRHWEGIRDDPPDPEFDQLTVPVLPAPPIEPMTGDPLEAAWVEVGNRSAVDAALTEALLHAVERYQGADAAGDPVWARAQALAAREYAGLLLERLPASNGALAAFADEVEADPRPIDAAGTQLESERQRLAAADFTTDEVAALRSQGLDDAEIEALRLELIAEPLAGGAQGDLAAAVREQIDEQNDTIADLQRFQAEIDVILTTLATNPLVSADRPTAHAGGPYSAAAGGDVALDGSGSTDPGGSIAAYAWDTDLDGAFDDATGATPTTPAPAGSGLVGLRVTDADGHQDTAYAAIDVTDANNPPTLAPTPAPSLDVPVGGTVGLDPGATDPDGDDLTYAWFVDAVPAGSSPTLGFGPLDATGIGVHEVRVDVSDGTATRTAVWYPTVRDADADGDGWHANADCDDTDADVHPLALEVEGNGIDDDCDPATSDAAVNDAPIATSLLVGALEDTPVTITLPAVDPEGDAITFTIVAPPATGSLGPVTGNQVVYTPAPDATGNVTFTFRAGDGELSSPIRTITVAITPVADAPVAQSVSVVTGEDEPVGVTLVGFDPDGSPVSYQIVAPPVRGSVGPIVGDLVTYTPEADATGLFSFTYRVTDGSETSEPATVRVRVQEADDPTAVADTATSTPEDTPVDVALPVTDVDGDALSFAVVDAPVHGTVSITGGTATYTPSSGFHGTDAFTWAVHDGTSWSPEATVDVTVSPVDDAPSASAVSVTTGEDVPVTVAMVGADPDGDALTFSIVTPPTHGTLSSVNGRRVVYTPDAEYAGPDGFTYAVTANGVTTAPVDAAITVLVANDAPVAVDDAGVTFDGKPVTVDVLANDTDIDGGALSIASLGTPSGGSATVVPGGIRVVPPVGHVGTVHVDYVVSDGAGGSATASLTVLVTESDVPGRTWTNETDFSAGDAFNIEQVGPNDLRIVDDAQAFNRIWVAVSTRGTIVKLDTNTGAILGEFWLSPDGMAKNPSRTTVDLDGNAWVTSRDGNSVTKLGLVENGQCEDRNGNGVIDTTTGQNDMRPWPNTGGVDSDGGVETAADECILVYTRVTATGSRHVSVTQDNDVWVSGSGNRSWDLIDGDTGQILRHEDSVGAGGYGGLMDPNGVIWSTTWGSLLRWDPANPLTGSPGGSPPDAATPPTGNWQLVAGSSQYGLCIDPQGNVWSPQLGSSTYKYAPNGALLGTYAHGFGQAQGCGVTPDGDVWVAHSVNGGTAVGHLKNDGTFVGSVPVGSGPSGIAVDAAGKVWATNYHSGTVSRIDPTAGPLGADGETAVGAVDFTSPYLNGNPYNYSDMTGSTLTGEPQSGTWSATFDAGEAGREWAAVAWRDESACEQEAEVRVSSSEDGTTFSVPSLTTDGALLSGVPLGRYLKVTVTLTRCPTGESMLLRDLTAWTLGPEAPSATDTQVTTPEETPVGVTLSAATEPAPGGPLTYELLRAPSKGTISTIGPDGSVTYTPALDATGYDSIGFRVSDEIGLRSQVAYAVIEITPVNDPPMAGPVVVGALHETPVDVTLDGDDVDGDDLAYVVVDGPVHGVLSSIDSGVVTYTPADGYVGPDSFTYRVNDGTVDSATATVSITVGSTVPGPPIDVSGIGGDGNARVQWEVPDSDGGSPITGYELVVSPGGATYDVGDALVFIVPGLVNDTPYTFTVRARNVNGYGPPSAGSNVVKPRPSCETDAFIDVDDTHPFCPEITWMADNGIANGYTDGTYRPLAPVTRQAMTAFVYRLAGAPDGANPTCSAEPFPDVPTTHDFCGEIAWAKAAGIATGYVDGSFRPGVAISRQALSAYLYRFSGSPRGDDPACDRDEFSDVLEDHPFCGEIDWLVDSGLATGYPDGRFQPTTSISRQAMAAFIFRYNVLTGIIG